ncbi:MAG: ABC transporter permease [Longimicrobiales bacterium]|nr:ABC transporter permease [Longimicrobiales bacterium]
MSPRPHTGDRVRAVYQWLLALYPDDFRERFEGDLLQAFDDRRGEARFQGAVGGLRLLIFLGRDFVTSVPLARTTQRRRGVDGLMNDILRDLRFSIHMLLKNPMFTVAAVATLALGIGLNAATFSAVHGILLRPLPGAEDPEELVQIYRRWPGIEYGSNSVPHYQDVRDRTDDVFENVASWYFQPLSVSAEGHTERTMGLVVSANFFQTYGVEPALGRTFIPGVEDRDPGAHPVAVISNGFWQTRFGGDPAVVGRTLTLNGRPYQIVGVAPADFNGPMTLAEPPILLPLMMANELGQGFDRITARGSNSMNVVGRMREGIDLDRVRERMNVVEAQLREEYPDAYDNQVGHTLVLQSEAGIHPSYGAAQMGMSTVMMVVVGLLLLLACVNVANLFLARARDRRREMGIRMSLGAGRGRIVQQLLTESLLFSIVAGLAGLAIAKVSVGFLAAFRPPIDGPWALSVTMDTTVLLFTAGVSLAAGFAFGMAPALQAARTDTVAAVKGMGGRVGSSRISSGLVVTQIALSLILLTSAGLFLRSLQSATRIDPGFDDPAHLVMTSADPGLQGYEEVRAMEFWDRVLDQVSRMPEVESAAVTSTPPLGLNSSDRGVTIPGYEFAENERSSLRFAYVSERYVETMGIDVLEGRTFTGADDADAPPVMVVNRRIAERFWPGESALGKTVETAGRAWTVVGVVETGKYGSLGEEPTEFMYMPHRQIFNSDLTLVARTRTDPQSVMQDVRGIIRSMDSDMPVYDVRTMEDHMGVALLPARLGGTVLGVFGVLGLLLAAVGIYGVMAYSVAQRKRELGIRVAMGADRSSVLRLVLGEGMKLSLVGTAIGLAAALGAAQLVQGLLYDVSAVDPVAFTMVPTTLVAVALLAVYFPARRAASVDPIRALKAD